MSLPANRLTTGLCPLHVQKVTKPTLHYYPFFISFQISGGKGHFQVYDSNEPVVVNLEVVFATADLK
jgi:hypothetical protein